MRRHIKSNKTLRLDAAEKPEPRPMTKVRAWLIREIEKGGYGTQARLARHLKCGEPNVTRMRDGYVGIGDDTLDQMVAFFGSSPFGSALAVNGVIGKSKDEAKAAVRSVLVTLLEAVDA